LEVKKMKGKMFLCLSVAVIVSVCGGCAALPYVIEAAQFTGGWGNNSYTPDLLLGAERESMTVGKYEVKVSRGFYKGNACTCFAAYDTAGRMFRWNAYLDNDVEDVKKIEKFNKMSQLEKKHFIKNSFSRHGIDLGPIEPKTAEKSPAPSGQDIPISGFAPTLR